MDGVAAHQVAPGEQHKVVETNIATVAVDEPDRMTGRDLAVMLLPQQHMDIAPIEPAAPGGPIIRDLAL